jgi:hypothetical protein
VLTAIELEELLASGSRMAQELQRDLLWLQIIQTPGASGTALSGQGD